MIWARPYRLQYTYPLNSTLHYFGRYSTLEQCYRAYERLKKLPEHRKPRKSFVNPAPHMSQKRSK